MSAATERFKRLIRTHGPIPVAQYMAESNALYYASRDPLGAGGDFVTAPEISQMFGEMIGLWGADLWRRAGALAPLAYVELGPGRGTLAADALRAMAAHRLQPQVHLVEGSPALREEQARRLPHGRFHEDIGTLPRDIPLLVVANEFFDALPVRQILCTADGWRERMVGLTDGALAFVAGTSPMDAAVPERWRNSPVGTILETSPASAAIMRELVSTIARQGGALLAIDYGHLAPRTGSTLQAVQAHRKIGVFDAPGEADLTAHVDFSVMAELAHDAGCTAYAATQGNWLEALGIGQRAARLGQGAAAGEVAIAHRRLTHPDEMGTLFKVFAAVAPGWPEPAGFG